MSGASQAWLVALREVRERGRSRSFLAGLAATLVIVVAMIVAPALLDPDDGTREVGVTGETPVALAAALRSQGDATDVEVAVRELDDLAEGREALREEDVDVLVVDARTLEWRERPDEQLQAVVTGAIQLVVVQERAVAAGISPDQLLGLVAPVPVDNVEIGLAEGRSPEDSTVAIAITALLLMAVYVYGVLVLTGVVEEKSSRVVEVLLARMSPRDLLIGKVAGIGLLGLAQFVLTALVAVVTLMLVDSVDLPALGNTVLAWVVAWFVLGYALYAVAYGALGSLASRTEDAQSVAGPVGYVLIAAYWASFLAISDDPDGGWSQVVSLFPATAPFAMPARIALGAHAWWEPFAAVALTVVAIAGLISFGGRVYTGAVLHSGPTLHLRDAWRRSSPAPAAGR